jgi:hypothetical protein
VVFALGHVRPKAFGVRRGYPLGFEPRITPPRGVAVDSAGKIYVSDAGNHTIRVGTP